MKYEAVLFDLDGTLVDTTHFWKQATNAALETYNIRLTQQEEESLAARVLHDVLHERAVDESTIQRVRAGRDAILHDLLRQDLRWKEGATQLLDNLNISTGIVTSCHRPIIDIMDEVLGLRSCVDTVVIAEDVHPYYKPDPRGLLLACEQLKCDPTRTLYIGDQPCDGEAANRAGMSFVLVHTPHTMEGAEQYAQIIVESLKELDAIMPL